MKLFRTQEMTDFPDVPVHLHQDRRPSLIPPADGSGGKAGAEVTSETGLDPFTSPHDDEVVGALAIESLRAAIDEDLAVSGHDNMYDRRSSSSFPVPPSDIL